MLGSTGERQTRHPAKDHHDALSALGVVNGQFPQGGVVLDSVGNLYGSTTTGGTQGFGVAYELTPHQDGSWTYTILAKGI